jgi:hypothetical protein
LHLLLMRWCEQMLLSRRCSQMPAPQHSWHWLLLRWCSQMPTASHSVLAFAPPALSRVLTDVRTPVLPACICNSCAGAHRCPRPRTPCIGSSGAGSHRCLRPHTCIGSCSAGTPRRPHPHSLSSHAPTHSPQFLAATNEFVGAHVLQHVNVLQHGARRRVFC